MGKLKPGIDFRNNWLYYNRSLIGIDTYTPENLHDILVLGRKAIRLAMEAVFDKTKANNPSGVRIHYPWLMTIKLAEAGNPDQAFTPQAIGQMGSNDRYDYDQLLPSAQLYWDAAADADFSVRVPGEMTGWDEAHDGTWLQIKYPDHNTADEPLQSTHVFDGAQWPIAGLPRT